MSRNVFTRTESGGRVAEGSNGYGDYRVEWDDHGHLVSHHIEIRTPAPRLSRPPEPIPDGYDPASEPKQGCCGQPDPSMRR